MIMVLFPMLKPLTVQIIAAIDTLFLLISFASYIFAYLGKNTLVQDIEE